MTADFGLVPDGFAEAVEKEEGAAAVRTCRGLTLQTVNNSAQPARRSAAGSSPRAIANAARILARNSACVSLDTVEHRGGLDHTERAAIRSTPGHISGE
jgi:hypothetical protein